MLRRDFQNLSVVRVREARALASVRLYDGAYYLGGFAVECALEAVIARSTQRFEFPELRRVQRAYTHNLEDLLRLAGLEPRLNAAEPAVRAAWATTKIRNVETRYQAGLSEADALEFLEAVAGRHGVLRWLWQFW